MKLPKYNQHCWTVDPTTKKTKIIQLVFACAWCPASRLTPLSKDEGYTHGICQAHFNQVMKKLKKQITPTI